jgi:hypothetical protein
MLLNQVFQEPKTHSRYRVILEHINDLMLIDIDSDKAWPIPVREDELRLVGYEPIEDPFPLPDVEEGSIAAAKRDEAWGVIAPLLEKYTNLCNKTKRNQLIKQRLVSTDKSRLYIVRHLRRYWQRGMAPNALAPDYHRCGGKGKPRREVSHKLGRKRSISPGAGTPVTEEVAELFRLAIEGFYLTNEKVPLTAAKDKAVGLFKARYPNANESSVPTMAQFRYFYQAHYLKSEVIRKRTPSRIYQKDMRALTSTSGNLNFGPGARYEIDATIADLYLVSDQEPDAIIGRPVMYFVKDVFSRMVVGMYIGLENPSWVAAMMALANAFTDKTAFCREYGVSIGAADWPSMGIPYGIMADRGELLYRQADVLVNRFGIQLNNSRAYRGDDKAICERYFNTIQSQFRPYVGGVVEPVNGKKRIGRRYELDATLGLYDFTRLVINLVINYNTRHVIDGYDFAPDMPESLPAVPLEIWNWGVQNRTGKLRSCDEDLAWINLLPYEQGSVSEVGITFKGLVYTCQEALKAGWFDRIRPRRPSKVEIAFDPRRTNSVYLRPDSKFESYWVCELADRSRRFRDMSFIEAAGVFKAMKRTEATARQKEDYEKPDALANIEKIVSEAKAKETQKVTMPASERLKGIRDNRSREKEAERNRTTAKTQESRKRETPADVVPLRPDRTNKNSGLDYPGLDAFLEDDDD